jgi:hypothetical protein
MSTDLSINNVLHRPNYVYWGYVKQEPSPTYLYLFNNKDCLLNTKTHQSQPNIYTHKKLHVKTSPVNF